MRVINRQKKLNEFENLLRRSEVVSAVILERVKDELYLLPRPFP